MAKRLGGSVRRGGNDVTDLDLLVGDDHPIYEQLHQPTLLLEGGVGESRPHLLAESLDRVGYPGDPGALPGRGLELAFLGKKGVGATLEFFALALELGELQHPAEVGVQQPLPLALGLGDGLADAPQPRLQLLGQPLAPVRSLQGVLDVLRVGEDLAQVLPHQLVEPGTRRVARPAALLGDDLGVPPAET